MADKPDPAAIEVHDLIWNDGFAVYARGWHEPEAFVAAVRERTGECPCLDGGDEPEHVYARLIPATHKDWDMHFKIVKTPGPGAFKATFMEHTI